MNYEKTRYFLGIICVCSVSLYAYIPATTYFKLNSIDIKTPQQVLYTFDPHSSYLLQAGNNTIAQDYPNQSFALKPAKDNGFLSEDNTLTIKPKSAASKQNTVTITYEGEPTLLTFGYNDISLNDFMSYDLYFQKDLFERELQKILPDTYITFDSYAIDLAFSPDGTFVSAADETPIALTAFHVFFTVPASKMNESVTMKFSSGGQEYSGMTFPQPQKEGNKLKLTFSKEQIPLANPYLTENFKKLYNAAIFGGYRKGTE